MLVIAGAVIFVLAFIKYRSISKAIAQHSSFQPPPEAVTTFTAKSEEWRPEILVVGSLEPIQGVVLSAEEIGKVAKVNFESGAQVKKGDVLIQFDTSVEEGNLKAAMARLDLARLELNRSQNLRARNVNSESDLNNSQATYRQAEGEVASIKGMILRKTITAPFDGEMGIRKVNLGEMVMPATPIVPLQNLDKLYLNFSVPQQEIKHIYRGQEVAFSVDAYPGVEFKGGVTAIDPQVENSTRNIMVQATVENSNKQLRPGMFASIKVLLKESNKVVVIPSTAISYAPYGDSIYIVENMKDPTGKEYLGIRQQFVALGESKGELVSITKGLNEGETVVTSGLFKLRPNAAVAVSNDIQPGSSANPEPEDT